MSIKDRDFDEGLVHFGPWTRWDNRKAAIPTPPCGGVYLFACSRETPRSAGVVDDLPEEIIYVGDTKNLTNRPLGSRHHEVSRYRELVSRY